MTESEPSPAYRVLARKYRPQLFSELVGQDVLVRTLTNAFESDRIAHAFLLTGVRGVGKTTAARIIARALNCVGPDGKGGPTVTPCGECQPCREIAEGRNVDVLEMDAASRTGVDDIRGLIDGVRYAPASARYKVYIIDEVHMLSKNAFNALLKTLEEPPPHVKFIFATTEARRLPLTVLSRCQRFDLRRLEPDLMIGHLGAIAKAEGADVEDAALALLARGAEGSVRDGLSLLDQAIAHGGGTVSEAQVQEMLGLADRGRVLDLLDALMAGDVTGALANLKDQYDLGADPLLVLQDLLELVHWLTRLKLVPDPTETATRTVAEQERGAAMAAKTPMATLARSWQMLLKGLAEAQTAPDPLTATEMVLVRLAYVAELPAPAELVEQLTGPADGPADSAPAEGKTKPVPGPGSPAPSRVPPPSSEATAPDLELAVAEAEGEGPNESPPPSAGAPAAHLADFNAVVEAAEAQKELALYSDLIGAVHLVRFEPGRVEFRAGDGAPPDLANRLATKLREWTGQAWVVALSQGPGAPTIREQRATAKRERLAEAAQDSIVRAVLEAFPGAEIRAVREPNQQETKE